MTAISQQFGHPIEYRDGKWVFCDTGEPVETTWKDRACGHCGQHRTEDGHDPCIANLPGVINACCGHGDAELAYVQFSDGRILRGFHYDEHHEKHAMRVYGQLLPKELDDGR